MKRKPQITKKLIDEVRSKLTTCEICGQFLDSTIEIGFYEPDPRRSPGIHYAYGVCPDCLKQAIDEPGRPELVKIERRAERLWARRRKMN